MPSPYTIRIFVPNGDPDGVRIIDRMNWTGVYVFFPRSECRSVVFWRKYFREYAGMHGSF